MQLLIVAGGTGGHIYPALAVARSLLVISALQLLAAALEPEERLRFNKVFGREFMGTYMAQVKRLRGGG